MQFYLFIWKITSYCSFWIQFENNRQLLLPPGEEVEQSERGGMNDLSNAALRRQQEIHHCPSFCNPIPTLALYVLLVLFLIGLAVSIFILIVVRNAVLLLLLLFFSALVATFLLWNSLQYMRNGALLFYLHSYPDSDLTLARHGQLVKFTGVCFYLSFS